MRTGRGITAAALSCAILTPGLARAQDARVQSVFAGSVGFTDNVTSAFEQEGSTSPPLSVPEADGFGTASPGLIFNYATPRTTQTLTYTFLANFFFRRSEANSYTNTLLWSGRFVTSPTTTLMLGATGGQGQLNTFQQSQSAGTTGVGPVQGGTTVFVQGGLNEAFSKQLSPVVSMGQTANFLAYVPIAENPPRTFTLNNALNAQRLFRHDTAALALTFAYTRFENVPEGNTFTSRDQLINTLVASWQHDYGHHISSQLDVGVTQANDLSGGYDQLWQPVGLAAVRYTSDAAQAELAYSHATALNVFLSQILLVDQVTLRLAAPLRFVPHLSVEGSLGFQDGCSIVDGACLTPSTAWLVDAALVYRPITPIPDFNLALRYQHINQRTMPTAADGSTIETQLVRNSIILAFGGAFPRTEETSSRILMTQPFGSASATSTPQRSSAPAEETEQEPHDAPR